MGRALKGVGVAVVAAIAIVLSGCTAPTVPAIDTTTEPSPGALADYSFGHTIGVADQFAAAPIDALQRLPIQLAVEPTSLRVHVRNWNYLADTPVPGSLSITGIWLGEQVVGDGTSPGYSAEATKIADGGTVVDGATYTSPWIDADTVTLRPGIPNLLSIGMRSDTGAALAITGGVSWLDLFGSSDLGGKPDPIGEFTAFSLLDVWVEYTVAESTETLVVLGHSLNSPGNIDPVANPHNGEIDSWPQLWANEHDAVASTLSASGSWLLNYVPDSPKLRAFEGIDPDYVSLWSASNDIFSDRPLVDVQTSFLMLLDRVRTRWPDAGIVAFTEPPRGGPQNFDTVRLAWNDWLLTTELGLTGVVDTASVLTNPADPLNLLPELTSDGAHLSLKGHQLVADLFADAITSH